MRLPVRRQDQADAHPPSLAHVILMLAELPGSRVLRLFDGVLRMTAPGRSARPAGTHVAVAPASRPLS